MDNQKDSLHIYDLNGSVNNKADIMQNFTIMFKTEAHSFDSQTSSGIPGGWRPWRRCYCVPRLFPDGSMSSLSDCLSIEDLNTGHGRCGRTGFFKQECSVNPCQ